MIDSTFDRYLGKKFHKLTVVRIDENVTSNNKGNYYRYCDVLCDCGTKKRIQFKFVKSGKTKSCGCIKSQAITNSNYDRWEKDDRTDRVGQKQGTLTILRRDYSKRGSQNIYWVCRCDCGIEYSISSNRLGGSNRKVRTCRRCYVTGATRRRAKPLRELFQS